MKTYLIEAGGAGFQVRAIGPDDERGELEISFPSQQQAQEWVDNQNQIAIKSANASDVA